jgi:fused signal recognition particle receptor
VNPLDRMIPDLQASFACEDVRVEASGAHTIVGVVNFIGAPSLPIQLLKLCVWTRWSSGVGHFEQVTRLVEPDEVTLLTEATTQFRLGDEESHTTNVNIFGGLQFSHAGAHHVEIYLDGELKLRFPLRVTFWTQLVDRFRGGETVDWEPLLIEADLGVKLATEWCEAMQASGADRSPATAEAWLREKMLALVRIPPPLPVRQKPEVILLVGVNGSGKTTTAAKLAARAQQEGRAVQLGAADTFRAAAAEQLEAWAERLQVPVTRGEPGGDPASVAVRALLAAQEAKADLLLIDTAGRQANKRNLLLELGKIKRSLEKKSDGAPHHTWLVADGTTGSGVVHQAREFHEAIGLTGLIVTKLDGSARGGMVAAVRAELGLPTYYLGRGETAADLHRFDAGDFVARFFGN